LRKSEKKETKIIYVSSLNEKTAYGLCPDISNLTLLPNLIFFLLFLELVGNFKQVICVPSILIHELFPPSLSGTSCIFFAN